MATINWIAGSGNWNTASNWNPSTVPGPSDDAVIAAAGGYTVSITNSISVGSIAINVGGATLALSGAGVAASVGGSVSNAGQLNLQDGATLTTTGGLTNTGNVYVNSGGSGGSSLTIGGTLTNSGYADVGNNSLATTVTAQGLSNTGTIDIKGGNSSNQALLDIAASAPSTWTGIVNISGNGLLEYDGSSGISAIASGAQINIFTSAGFVAAAGLGTTSNTALTGLTSNAGQLDLQDGATLTTTGGLTNTGNVYLNSGGSGGSSLTIGGTLTNSGYADVGNNSLATTVTAQGLSNTGTIDIKGGNSSNQALLDIAASAPSTWTGIVNISGNGLLEYDGSSGISAIASGAQINIFTSAGFVAAAGLGTTSNTALTGLTSNAGQLNLQDGATLTTTGGLTNTGNVYLNSGGSGGSSLTIGGTLTNSGYADVGNNSLATTVTAQGLSNTGTIDIKGGNSSNQALLDIAASAPSTWTGIVNISGNGLLEYDGSSGISAIASGAQINIFTSAGFVAAAGLGTTSNTALTGLTSNAGQLNLQDGATLTTTGGLTNTGNVYLNSGGSGGSSLTIGGTLTNSGYADVGNNSLATTVTAQGLSNTGTIDIKGGNSSNQALLDIAASAPSTWTGIVNISGNGLLEYDGSSGISAIASGAQINIFTSAGFVAAAGLGTTSNTALTGLTSNAGQLNLQDGATLTTTGGLTNTGNVYVNSGGSGGSSLTIGGTLTNSGYADVGNNSLATTVTAQGLSNTGTIDIKGGNSSNQALLDIAASAPSTWTGIVNISGNGLLEYDGSSGISAIASGAQINIFTSAGFVAAAGLGTTSNTALTGLTSNAGQLNLQDGATLTTTGGLTNTGNVYLNSGGSGGSSLTIGGTLTNSGYADVGNNSLATTVTAQGLSNTGTIDIRGASATTTSLAINGSASNASTINITSYGNLFISGSITGGGTINIGADAQLSVTGATGGTLNFQGGDATLTLDSRASFTDSILGFTLGDSIRLKNTDAVGASVVGQTLTVTLAGGGQLTYNLAGNFAGESFNTAYIGSDSVITLVTGTNIPPSTSVPSTINPASGVVTAITPISIADADAANFNEIITTKLSDSNGQLFAYAGVTGGGGTITGIGTNQLTIAGSLAQVNADLSTLTILEEVAGSDTIDVATNDGRGGSDDHSDSIDDLRPR